LLQYPDYIPDRVRHDLGESASELPRALRAWHYRRACVLASANQGLQLGGDMANDHGLAEHTTL